MRKAIIPQPDYQGMTVDQRLMSLLEMSLDRCAEILAVPPHECTAIMLNAQVQTVRAVMHACVKMGIESKRLAHERDKVIGELAAEFRKGVPKSE
jgi:hypothetical protein